MNVQISVKESVNLVVVIVVINVYLFGTAKQRGNAAFFRCKPSLLSIISRCTNKLKTEIITIFYIGKMSFCLQSND